MSHHTESGAPVVGDFYRWSCDLADGGHTIRVLAVGRKYATIQVVQSSGALWTKRQPLPLSDSFVRVTPPVVGEGA